MSNLEPSAPERSAAIFVAIGSAIINCVPKRRSIKRVIVCGEEAGEKKSKFTMSMG